MSQAPERRGLLAGVILAGGASTRMGRPKAALALGGEPFVARIARSIRTAGLDPLLVVTGVHDTETRAALPEALGAVVARNPEPADGQISSLRLALDWLDAHRPEVAGALVALVDHPAVAPGTYAALARVARDAPPGIEIALPVRRGRRGHPVVFLRAVWGEILRASGPEGARAVVRRVPGRVAEVEVDDDGIHANIDRPEDLERLGKLG